MLQGQEIEVLEHIIDCWHFWLELMEVGVLAFMLVVVFLLYHKTKQTDKEIEKHHGKRTSK